MKIKRIIILVTSFLITFSLTSCNSADRSESLSEIITVNVIEDITVPVSYDVTEKTTVLSVDTSETTEAMTTESADDPADWSTEQIVDAYKNAAKKSDASVKSSKSVEIKRISVNNGQYKGLFEFITPIMSKLIANNSEDEDGITGGFNNLTASDIASAKAYKSGNNLAIEMTMREQISGACENKFDGTVGHAITTVGDLSFVTNQLKDLGLPLNIPEENTKIYYTKPVVKVIINNNGEIVNGTWRYTVEIRLNDYKAFGKPVNTTSVVMDNTITVNGGFE